MRNLKELLNNLSMDDVAASSSAEPCKGLFYRLHKTAFRSQYGSFETRWSLRLLKRKSCPGCRQCASTLESLQYECDDLDLAADDVLQQAESGAIVELVPHWSGYGEDTEFAFEFVLVDSTTLKRLV